MTRTIHRTILMIVGLVAYVLLTRGLYPFIEMDRCLDDGGVIDGKTGACDGGRSGVANFFAQAAPVRTWVLLFTVPVIPSLIAVTLARAVLRPWAPPSNSAIDTDTARSPLRAPSGAGHRER